MLISKRCSKVETKLNFYNGASAATAYINYASPGNVLVSRNLFVEANASGGTSGTVRIDPNGNVGIGTTGPNYKLDVTDFTQTQGLLNGATIEDVKTSTYFTHSTADLNFDIDLGNISYWGELEVSITGSYSNQNTPGKLTRVYALGLNPSNAIYTNESRISYSLGAVPDNVYLDGLRWDSTTSTYKIRVAHLNSNGNAYNVRINGFTYGTGNENLVGWGLGGLYTQSVSGLSRQYPYYNGNLGVGTATPATKLDVYQGDIRRSGIVSGGYIELGSLPGYGANAYQSLTSGGSLHFSNNGKYCAYLEGADTVFGVLNTSAALKVKLNTNGNTYFVGGNVGIGTTTPQTTLEVDGADSALNAHFGQGQNNSSGVFGGITFCTS